MRTDQDGAVLGFVSNMTHDEFGGLQRDLSGLVDRRRALRWMGGLTVAGMLAACTTGDSDGETGAAMQAIPDEATGPFPANGSIGPNLLRQEGVVRSDITTSVGSSSGAAVGVPASISLTVIDAATESPLPGAAVYVWHCTADGRYSIYEVEDQNYLRGVQVADDDGRLSFDTVFPGCYPGRWPHCHLEVYESVDGASTGGEAIKTSQLALPQSDCETVYGDNRYGDSLSSLAELSLASDGVFADGWEDQLATVAGSIDDGYQIELVVRI